MGQLSNATSETFKGEVLEHQGVVLVDFWAPWCGPCKAMEPALNKLAANMPNVKIVKVQADAEADLAKSYGVRSIPALMIFKDGQVIDQTVGLQSLAALTERMQGHVG